jgi:hypothetical protein
MDSLWNMNHYSWPLLPGDLFLGRLTKKLSKYHFVKVLTGLILDAKWKTWGSSLRYEYMISFGRPIFWVEPPKFRSRGLATVQSGSLCNISLCPRIQTRVTINFHNAKAGATATKLT